MKTLTVSSLFVSLFTSLLCSAFALTAQAETFHGQIKRFQGSYVETPNRRYDYLAFVTEDGRRIAVPSEINGAYLQQNGHKVIVKAKEIQPLFCTDMSRACLSGTFQQIEKITIIPVLAPSLRSPMTCMAYWEGYVFENRKCVLKGGSGCSNPFPYKTLEACEEENF